MLLPFFQWMESLAVTKAILQSADWFGAMTNIMHLLSLVVFFGALLIVDLRLLGRGLTRESLADVARDARPWLVAAFIGLVVTGIPQVMLSPMREYYSDVFWLKMRTLLVAALFTFTVRDRVTRADEARLGPVWGKVVGLVSMALWAGVAIPGRLIGLLT